MIFVLARRTKDRIHYKVVDEYEGETLTGKSTRSSKLPLTLGELVDFFLEGWDLFEVLEMNFGGMSGYPPEQVRSFFVASSEFYRDFGKLIEQRVEKWLHEKRSPIEKKPQR